jgi:hypothetical protein
MILAMFFLQLMLYVWMRIQRNGTSKCDALRHNTGAIKYMNKTQKAKHRKKLAKINEKLAKVNEIILNKYGLLTVIEAGDIRKGKRKYFCKCDCGGTIWTTKNNLVAGYTKSCGCLRRKETRARTLRENIRFSFNNIINGNLGFALEMYNALSSTGWVRSFNPNANAVFLSWRTAADMIADMYNKTEVLCYMNFYFNGDEGIVSDQVRRLMREIDWEPLSDDRNYEERNRIARKFRSQTVGREVGRMLTISSDGITG